MNTLPWWVLELVPLTGEVELSLSPAMVAVETEKKNDTAARVW
ncbi:hypothetical protein HanRHA438_Chr17g0800351 [Helianthus annuus]|nr:hypothetical protein HanRHA438_Chr17g0800351 [Helianthus annuus]